LVDGRKFFVRVPEPFRSANPFLRALGSVEISAF